MKKTTPHQPAHSVANSNNHNTGHLFNCTEIPTDLTKESLWTDPVGAAALLEVWGGEVGLAPSCGGLGPWQSSLSRGGLATTTIVQSQAPNKVLMATPLSARGCPCQRPS